MEFVSALLPSWDEFQKMTDEERAASLDRASAIIEIGGIEEFDNPETAEG